MKRDNDNGKNSESKMFGKLAESICGLTDAVSTLSAQMKAGLATKADVAASEARIIKAFGERVDPAAVGALGRSADDLAKAVADNQPKLSG